MIYFIIFLCVIISNTMIFVFFHHHAIGYFVKILFSNVCTFWFNPWCDQITKLDKYIYIYCSILILFVIEITSCKSFIWLSMLSIQILIRCDAFDLESIEPSFLLYIWIWHFVIKNRFDLRNFIMQLTICIIPCGISSKLWSF